MLKIKKIIRSFIFKSIYILALFEYSFKNIKIVENKSLLIVKIDAIGDYVLFRNFLEEIKKSDIYKDYKITFLGNIVIKDLAENLDKEFIDKFIWVDRNNINIFKKPLGIFKIINVIHNKFNVVIQSTYSREVIGDLLVRFSGAETKIGFNGDYNNISLREKNKSDKWYTELISIDSKINFEFYKNRSFFSQILKKNLSIQKPSINIDRGIVNDLNLPPKDYIVLFPGAQQDFRKWPPENFKLIAEYIIKNFNLDVIICGSNSDKILADIINSGKNARIFDLTGKTNLIHLVSVISKSKLVISNDTSGAHISVALDTPVIILSQFNYYRRFVPYPKEISDKMICLTPNIFNNLSEEEKVEKFKLGSNENISLISVEEVKRAIDNIKI